MHTHTTRRRLAAWLCILTLTITGELSAQAPSAAGPPAQAPAAGPAPQPPPATPLPPAATVPAPGAPAPAEPATDASCFPSCRAGYLCSAGQCISACNPPCGAGERCTAAAECVPDAPPPPPPSYLDRRVLPPPPPPAPEAGVHTHDGFLLRVTLGFGGGSTTESYRGDALGLGVTGGDIEYSGGGFRLGIDVGGALSSALTVHGRLSVGTLNEPSTFIDGADYDTPQGTEITASLLGVGLTYTIMPLNLHVAGVVGLAAISVRDDDPDTADDQGEGEAGPGAELDVGKEWWIGPQLGLGVVLRLSFAASDYDGELYDSDRTWLGAGVVCSLAYQ